MTRGLSISPAIRTFSTAVALLIATGCTGEREETEQQPVAARLALADDDTDLGQTGGAVGGTPKRCPELPQVRGANVGFGPDTLLTDRNLAEAWVTYIDSLCFVEEVRLPGPPASHLARKGAADVKLWILPERHVHTISAATLRDTRGRVVARIWNADPNARDFPEWPGLKHNDRSAYVWIGKEENSSDIVAKVIKLKRPSSANPQVEVLKTARFVNLEYVPRAKHEYARAMWGHPPGEHAAVRDSVLLQRLLTAHNTGWFDCDYGCCGVEAFW